jgi:hypothetical protein
MKKQRIETMEMNWMLKPPINDNEDDEFADMSTLHDHWTRLLGI